MDEFMDSVAKMVTSERRKEFNELRRSFRGSKSAQTLNNAILLAADRTASVMVELERVSEKLEECETEKARVTAELDKTRRECVTLEERAKQLEEDVKRLERENAEQEPRRVFSSDNVQQSQVLALQVAELTRRHVETVERESQLRAESESLANQVRELESELRRKDVAHAKSEETQADKLRETLRLLNSAGSMRHMDFLPVVRGRSYKEVTLNGYLQYVRNNEQLYREKCGTFLTQGIANILYDNACMGAVGLLPSEWVSRHFVKPLVPYAMVHHYEEFLHYRIVLSNCTGLFAQMLTVVQLNAVGTENRRKITLTEFRNLSNISQEPVRYIDSFFINIIIKQYTTTTTAAITPYFILYRQFKCGIEMHSQAFQQYQDLFLEYVRAERAATEPLPSRSAQYGPLENQFKVSIKGTLLDSDRNATANKRKRMAVDDLLNYYGAAGSSQS
ncbi:protein ORF70 [Cyprinid herpesvirus 2]|nr:protein ORF70 [Cyprinid herpesvirus 2]